MEAEISEQLTRLPEVAPGYLTQADDAVANRPVEMILLAARGSSDNAALYARYLIEVHLKRPVVLAAPSVLTRFQARVQYPPTLAIGISQSGEAPDVSEMIAEMRDQGHCTLAITNTPGRRLSSAAEFTLDLGVGVEHSIAATKTYTATLVALYQTVRALGAALPEPTLPGTAWSKRCRTAAAEEDFGWIVRSQPVFALGRGYRFASAHEAALKLMECALVPCKAYSSADFEHGPKALAGPGSAVVSFDGWKENLADLGATILPVPQTDAPDECIPFFDAVYLQHLALEVARARGLDPDQARFLSKVTQTR
jgi:glucosamine--fructose-6-phosphate aminotransferase (isomerizing)